jgi:hypothetical protein
VRRREASLQQLLSLAADQAQEAVWPDRTPHGNGRSALTRYGRLRRLAQFLQYARHGADHLWQIGGGNLIVRDIGGYDLNGSVRQTYLLSAISHGIFPIGTSEFSSIPLYNSRR